MIRHIVLFAFKADLEESKVIEADRALKALPRLIAEVSSFESGLNTSPENLAKGFTHAYLFTFLSEEDRDAYLVHPDHIAFTKLIEGRIDDVLVFDYSLNS